MKIKRTILNDKLEKYSHVLPKQGTTLGRDLAF